MTRVSIDDALVREAASRYPQHSPEEIAAEALESYLAYAELLEMKGMILVFGLNRFFLLQSLQHRFEQIPVKPAFFNSFKVPAKLCGIMQF
jgi:hypothetical protein